jgi:hypothetical protein
LLIAVAGRGGEGDRHRSAAAGMHLYLRRPVDAAALRKLLEQFKATSVG